MVAVVCGDLILVANMVVVKMVVKMVLFLAGVVGSVAGLRWRVLVEVNCGSDNEWLCWWLLVIGVAVVVVSGGVGSGSGCWFW